MGGTHSSHRYTRGSGVEESPSQYLLSQCPLNPRGRRIRAALGMVPWFCRSPFGPAPESQGPALPGRYTEGTSHGDSGFSQKDFEFGGRLGIGDRAFHWATAL